MDHLRLYRIIEQNRYEDEHFSFPFLVHLENGENVFSWFSYELFGNISSGVYIHIEKIMVIRSDEHIITYPACFDMPYLLDAKNEEKYMEYLETLMPMQNNFSEEKMNSLLQDFGMKPLFHAFQCVRNYIKTHYKGTEEE